jgi:hypothetical protein
MARLPRDMNTGSHQHYTRFIKIPVLINIP